MHNKSKKVASAQILVPISDFSIDRTGQDSVRATRCNIAHVKYKADQNNMSNWRKQNQSITKYKS